LPHAAIDLRKINTYPIHERKNLVKLADLIKPGDPVPPCSSPDIDHVIAHILEARRSDRPVILMMGGHVIKCGLSLLLIEMLRSGIITHIAGNGAVSIHDMEIAMVGETSEDVATSIEDGSFGMAEETGVAVNRALRKGAITGLGYGEALGRYIAEGDFPYREYSVLYNAYRLGIPMTIHATIGTDIVHQHPECDFGILGAASGQDFKIFCASISKLEKGVFLNYGSAVTGPEVFLKAVSITRNLGYPVHSFTTANFDIIPLGEDYRSPSSTDTPEYYYRPKKNVIIRPTSLDGQGYHIQGDHLQTLPYLYHAIAEKLEAQPISGNAYRQAEPEIHADVLARVTDRSESAAALVRSLIERNPDLEESAYTLCLAYLTIASCFDRSGTLFICGNGGSMADALHISGELLKSYNLPRPISNSLHDRLRKEPDGEIVAAHLEGGLRTVVLGANPALSSAVDNDFGGRGLGIAQELNALARTGDVLLGISTSGKALNVYYAAIAARSLGLATILLTGERESRLSNYTDIAIHAPARQTDLVQEYHITLYHCLCGMLEQDFFA